MKKTTKTVWGIVCIVLAVMSFVGHIVENTLNGMPWYFFDEEPITAFSSVATLSMPIIGAIMLFVPWKEKVMKPIFINEENECVYPEQRNGVAIAAFVLGIFGFLFSGAYKIMLIITIISIILAITAIKNAYKDGIGGEGLSKWALTISISTIIGVIFVMITFGSGRAMVDSNKVSETIAQQEETAAYSKGILTETTYESEFIGVKFETSDGWRIKSKDEIIELFGETYGEQIELMIFHTDTNTNIILIAEKLLKSVTIDQYKAITKQNLVTNGMQFSEDKGTVTILGEDYELLQFSTEASLGVVKADFYGRVKGERAISFMVNYLDENKAVAEEGLNLFKIYNSSNTQG